MTEPHLPDRAFALPDAELLAIAGPDAMAFAQAQFTNDVEALVDGQWQWNGWLDAKGRLQALFGLLREDDQRLLAWLPAGGAGHLGAALARFRFRSKLQLQPERGRSLVAVPGAGAPAPGVLTLPSDAHLGLRHLRLVAGTVAPGAPSTSMPGTPPTSAWACPGCARAARPAAASCRSGSAWNGCPR